MARATFREASVAVGDGRRVEGGGGAATGGGHDGSWDGPVLAGWGEAGRASPAPTGVAWRGGVGAG
jgi:hypothetical protein